MFSHVQSYRTKVDIYLMRTGKNIHCLSATKNDSRISLSLSKFKPVSQHIGKFQMIVYK